MFKVREKEPGYAFIPDVDAPEKNRYGTSIETVPEGHELRDQSLNINGDSAIGTNPNRYKQHGFYFNADNCISCHACESACSEKNDLPPHLAYRAVGYVEGGSYPNYTRLNISMACNHCDDPVCLKGCPTRAYTKFAEYGAVLQDPDICFGCGYCTWVCPYNAPQLDMTKGHVHKCNMCVDRLEVGLKPACVSACLGDALDFGVIETTPENRDQLETKIPGFPTPEITHPNIRFQQTNSLPREMSRTDSMPLRYERDDQGRPGETEFHTKVDEVDKPREWNLSKLRSREDPLVIFTLISQGVVGAFLMMFLSQYLAPLFGADVLSMENYPVTMPIVLFALLGLQTFGLALSTMHLGKPHRFYRAFNNLKHSPVSREVASIAVFFNFFAAYTVLTVFSGLFSWLPAGWLTSLQSVMGWGAAISGPVALYFMHSIYRIKARPFWNHWQVLTSFYGSMFSLGALVIVVAFGLANLLGNQSITGIVSYIVLPLLFGLALEGFGLYRHRIDMKKQGGEGAASFYEQTTTFGKTYILRNSLLFLSLTAVILLSFVELENVTNYVLWTLLTLTVLAMSLVGRALFYVLIIPTTMPGAFFWRNKGFQEHARETGLAEMPQVGVLPETH